VAADAELYVENVTIQVPEESEKAYAVWFSSKASSASKVVMRNSAIYGARGLYANGNLTTAQPEIVLENVDITATDGSGLYLAGNTKTTITGGTIRATESGGNGLEVRAGVVELNGVDVICESLKDSGDYDAVINGNGSTGKYAALSVARHSTNANTSVTVTGGSLTGAVAIGMNSKTGSQTDDVNVTVINANVDGEIINQYEGSVLTVNGVNWPYVAPPVVEIPPTEEGEEEEGGENVEEPTSEN
jgi:hypothetical protein